jgi:hypothetical protein
MSSRYSSSQVTFGPVGRLVCTVVVLGIPVWFVKYGSIFGLLGAVTWCVGVLPRAWKDIWRRAPERPTELTALRDATAREARQRAEPHPLFEDLP